MNLDFTEEEIAFRDEVRSFLEQNYPRYLTDKVAGNEPLEKEDYVGWLRILNAKGWAAPAWSVEHGGTGWSPTQRYIWNQELGRAGAISHMSFGIAMCGPVIQKFGSDEQKARFLPPMLTGDVWWCQGYSEPGAGSDLASLTTRADRFTAEDGREYYRVNGQKTWTTYAHYADWGFFLVRTSSDGKPQEGISFLLIDMTSPGVTVRPIEILGGHPEVNEVWLEDVIVPIENRVYEENKGWTCAKYLLGHERSNQAEVAASEHRLSALRAFAAVQPGHNGRTLLDDPAFALTLARLEIDLKALEMTELRVLAAETSGAGPGPEMSLLKTRGSEIQQRIAELFLQASGMAGMRNWLGSDRAGTNDVPWGHSSARRSAQIHLNLRKVSIYGGSNEIQRNIIAKQTLGL